MVTASDRKGRGGLGCLASLAVLGLLGYVATRVVPPWTHYEQYADQMRENARFGLTLPDSAIRARLIAQADSLELPEAARHISIVRRAGRHGTITIKADYIETISLPLIGVRHIHFIPTAVEPL